MHVHTHIYLEDNKKIIVILDKRPENNIKAHKNTQKQKIKKIIDEDN